MNEVQGTIDTGTAIAGVSAGSWPATPSALRLEAAEGFGRTADQLLQAASTTMGLIGALHGYTVRIVEQFREAFELEARAFTGESARPGEQRALLRRSMIAELACALNVTEVAAGRLLDESEALTRLPSTLEALTAGRISHRHAQVILGHADGLPEEVVPAFEEAALAIAARANPAKLARAARNLREALHPEPSRRGTRPSGRSVASSSNPPTTGWRGCTITCPLRKPWRSTPGSAAWPSMPGSNSPTPRPALSISSVPTSPASSSSTMPAPSEAR